MRSEETTWVGAKWRAAKVDFPLPEGPASTTSACRGRTSLSAGGNSSDMDGHNSRPARCPRLRHYSTQPASMPGHRPQSRKSEHSCYYFHLTGCCDGGTIT